MIHVVLYGCAAKPEDSDEIKGFFVKEQDAKDYCSVKNTVALDGHAYWYETINDLRVK